VGVHRAVGQRELDVATGSAGAPFFPLRQLEAGQVRNEVGLPLMAPRLHRAERLGIPAPGIEPNHQLAAREGKVPGHVVAVCITHQSPIHRGIGKLHYIRRGDLPFDLIGDGQ